MISLFIFFIHIVGAAFAFTRSYCDHKLGDAFMTLAFVAIIFSVSWTIAGFVVRFLFPTDGFGVWFDSDTLSLVIVTVLESILYTVYFRSRRAQTGVSEA